jgi:PAS domain S-box-containing protein
MKALLVEDNAADVRMLRELLKEFPSGTFELQHVDRLDLALERLQSEIFDVVLLDLGLPDSWGVETLTITHKIASGLPIVVLTGLDDEQFALEVVRAGAQDYLVKGRFDSQLLARTIRYAVKRKQAEEEVRRLNAELEMRVAERTAQFQAANEELRKELIERKRAEEALRESEEQFRNLANAIPQLCWMANADGWIFWYNQRWYQYTGTTPEQMEGWGWKSVHDPDVLPGVMGRWTASIDTGQPFDMVFPLRGADGLFRKFLTRVIPIKSPDGKVVRWFGTNTDITDIVQAEEALQRSEERFRALVMAGSNVVFSMGPDGREMRNLVGKGLVPDTDTPSGTWMQKYIPTDDQPRVWSAVQKALRDNTLFELEHRFLLADGSLGWAVSRAVPLKDAQGNVMEWFGAANDITERKRAEQVIRDSESKYRNLFNSLQELVTVHRVQRDLNGRIVERRLLDGNPAFLSAVGVSSIDELRGRTTSEIFGVAWSSSHADAIQQAMDSGQSVTQEVHRSESGRDYITTIVPLDEDTYFGTGRDITERKHAEAELKKLNRTLEAMKNSNEAILRATDEQQFLKEVCHIFTRDCNHATVWIGIAENHEGKPVRPVAYSGVEEGYLETLRVTWDDSAQGRGTVGTAIRTGQPSMCRNTLTDPSFVPWREEAVKRGYASVLAIPLKERGETWGAITIYSREPDAFSQGEVDLLTDLARDLEFGIQSLRLRAARALAEEALRESEEQLSLFVEYAPAALAMFDKQMRYLRVSQRWRADYGLGDRDLRGVSHYDVFPEVSDEWKEAHRRALAGEVLRNEADRFERADGTVQWIRREVLPWRDSMGTVGGILIFNEDLTEHIQAQEALLRSEKEAFQRGQLRALTEQMRQAREEERKEVARDLHDDIGQLLTAIKIDLTWTKRHLTKPEGEVQDRLARSIGMISDGANSVRKICAGLRPGILDDLGLPAAIEWHANDFTSRTGIPCEIKLPSNELHIDSGKSIAIFRIFQECLTNVMRHAEAKSVRVSLRGEEGTLLLTVQDDGVGFAESSVSNSTGSLGLLGMKERAQACGGDVQISSSPGNGTTVSISVPLEKECAKEERSFKS